jgi:hypothetical protein
MLKVSLFQGETEYGPSAVPLFGPADSTFEKVASAKLLPDVNKYIASLRPQKGSQYVLVNAMGASEYYGSNINGDAFPEASLIHAPNDWAGNPLLDKVKAKDWPYGYPTFYLAHPYAHHRNKDASRAFGEVELAVWHPNMKRVELVCRVDEEKCQKFGGVQVWDKLQAGQFPDVSMGTKVPYDTCSICLDRDTYRRAQSTFIPGKDKHPGDAVLRWHKAHKIRGVSITRKDYCEHALRMMNKILPDGRKVFVENDYPKFFDISFVFIGADRTAKTMLKIAGDSRVLYSFGSAEQAEKLGYAEGNEILYPAFLGAEKVASVQEEDPIKLAFFGKGAALKQSEMTKDVMPSQFAGKAIPLLTKSEEDLPDEVLSVMNHLPLEDSLSTASGLGVILRPREFERITDSKDDSGIKQSPEKFNHALAQLLLPLLAGRSMLGPFIERRTIIVVGASSKQHDEMKKGTSSHSSSSLRKMSSAYDSYRHGVTEMVAHSQDLLGELAGGDTHLAKLADAPADQIFTPLSVAYIQDAFQDEASAEPKIAQASATVERAAPSANTSSTFPKTRRIQ